MAFGLVQRRFYKYVICALVMWQSFFVLEVVPYFMTLPEVSEYKPLWHIFHILS